jgi:hypothetical protein
MDLTSRGHSFEALLSLAARQPGMSEGKGRWMQTVRERIDRPCLTVLLAGADPRADRRGVPKPG